MAAVSLVPSAKDRQPRSKDSTALADRQLPLVEKGDPIAVDPALVRRQRSMLAAIALAIQAAGLQEKEVSASLGIDPGHWTRILAGAAHFPLDRLGPLMDLCGNESPLRWLAHSRGYELRPLETELERRLREERESREKVEAENRVLRSVLEGRTR